MDEILKDFKEESKGLVVEMTDILDDVEGEFANRNRLEQYGQLVDRIMGGAQSLEMALEQESAVLSQIGKYAEICKAVGYKASQIDDNEQFFDVVVAFLLDATEALELMLGVFATEEESKIKNLLNETFLDRVKWISSQFKAGVRASVAVEEDSKGASQADIDALLKALGV